MDYKIIFSDLDGTLLTSKNDVSDLTISEINKIKDRIPLILVSARMPKSMTYLQDRLGIRKEPIICYNGALVMAGNNVISSVTISMPVIESLYGIAVKNNIRIGLYFEDEWYVEETSERIEKEIFNTKAKPVFKKTNQVIEDWKEEGKSAHKIMCMGTEQDTDRIFPVLNEVFGKELNIYRSNATLIEIADKKVSKVSGIETILKKFYPIALEDAVAFGDNYNDIEMIKAVGHGVAMGNAREELKEVANATILHHKEDGVAKYVKHLF
ncbi:Cof-type HAD-IIB family hydrolase [Flavobacteriaceae bacterium R38]|nr:Cof-type HAD-IIB family hydrolase [Flavobacteriaceae bacterium R38]